MALCLAVPLMQKITTQAALPARQMENLDRGVVAVKVSTGVFISWRMLGSEPTNVTYNIYRGTTKLNSTPLSNTNYTDTAGTTSSTYSISAVINGVEQAKSTAVTVWSNNFLSIPLQVPSGGTTPTGEAYTYEVNDTSVGDLDGDHQYELIVKWQPTNAKDNSQSGYTGNTILDAYKMNGTRLWRIDLGKNIRSGAHYTQFMVYDLDGDGRAEVACKTADGTVDGTGAVIGSATADYRNSNGYILSGPEYLTIFSSASGRALETVSYQPVRGTVSDWGDSYGNRVDRFLAGIAYLDGTRPSLVMCRGYYTRMVLVAWDYRGGSLTKRWTFDTNDGYSSYEHQGNHNLSIADVDNDGKDEIMYGSVGIDDNGAGMYSTGKGHGDAMHLTDISPDRAGMEVWQCHETGTGTELRDAATGQIIFSVPNSGDVGRAMAADIDPNHKGLELWSSGTGGIYNATGTKISTTTPSINFGIWWDGDLQRELLDGDVIDKWNPSTNTTSRLLTAYNSPYLAGYNNSTKKNPCLQADLIGDWREEVVWRTQDNTKLIIATTTATTSYRMYTLMHDIEYRLSVAWQNVGYNQPPHTSYYLGSGMSAITKPNIYLTN